MNRDALLCLKPWIAANAYAHAVEYRFACGAQVDLLCINRAGVITGVEIKASRRDFQRSPHWAHYLHHVHALFIAFPAGIALPHVSRGVGIILFENVQSWVLRPATTRRVFFGMCPLATVEPL